MAFKKHNPGCCCFACIDVEDVTFTPSGVTNGSNCTNCSAMNDVLAATKSASIEFPLTSCNNGTVLDEDCVWVFYGSQTFTSCSSSYQWPIMQFAFFSTSDGKIFAQLQIGDDVGNDVNTYYLKEVSGVAFPVSFTSSDRQTSSPCVSNNNACNWSSASVTVDEA